MRSPTALTALALLLSAGCVRTYRPPQPGEPAALLKVRLGYDHATAVKALPAASRTRAMVAQVLVREPDGRPYLLASQRWADQLERVEAAPLDTLAANVHADRGVQLDVRLAVTWQVTTTEFVTETHRVPTQVTRMESQYNSSTRSYDYRSVTRTEYKSESRQVQKQVTRNYESGCTARVPLLPAKGAVYLVDYANPLLSSGCSAAAFLQSPNEDGTFSLQKL